jgi:hypothetical protein
LSALRIAVAVVVAVVWAVVYLAAVFSHGSIHAPPELSGVMLAVVTWLFGSEIRKQMKGNGNGS